MQSSVGGVMWSSGRGSTWSNRRGSIQSSGEVHFGPIEESQCSPAQSSRGG